MATLLIDIQILPYKCPTLPKFQCEIWMSINRGLTNIFEYPNHNRILLCTSFPNVRTSWTCTSFKLPVSCSLRLNQLPDAPRPDSDDYVKVVNLQRTALGTTQGLHVVKSFSVSSATGLWYVLQLLWSQAKELLLEKLLKKINTQPLCPT